VIVVVKSDVELDVEKDTHIYFEEHRDRRNVEEEVLWAVVKLPLTRGS
jgi:hypothetical protein